MTRKHKWAIAMAGAAAIGLLLYFSGFTEAFISGFEGHPGLPSCESTRGQSDAKKALENAPLAKSIGIAIIAITNAKTISANAQKVECTATAILNSATDGTINYSFTNDPSLGRGKYYIQSSLEPDSFHPHQLNH